ncbi:MAG: DNA recombination protein RmuC, partial [bacterium]|nr:DNA recombination protein RmuC [bacterium]
LTAKTRGDQSPVISELKEDKTELIKQRGELEILLRSAEGQLEATKASLAAERKNLLEQRNLLEEAEKKFKDVFTSLAQEALTASKKDFLQLAEENFEKKRKEVDKTIQPLSSALDEYRKQTGELKTTLDKQQSLIGKLDEETGRLLDALKRPGVRGRWGEVQLRRLVELAGMQVHVDFEEQVSVEGEGGRLRPDMVIHLPNDRIVVIDAKTSADHYLQAQEKKTEEERQYELKEFARTVKDRMRDLGKKEYWMQFDRSPEFVIQFLNVESFFAAALEYDPTLIEHGLEQGVLLSSPLSLMSLLLAVKQGWREEALQENAQKIAVQGREIFERLCKMTEHIDNLGRNLVKALENYNNLVGSLERNVLPSARRIKELEITTTRELTVLDEKDISLRRIQAPELLPGGESGAPPDGDDKS